MSLALLRHFWKLAERKDAGHGLSSVCPVSPGDDQFVLLPAEASPGPLGVPWEWGEDRAALALHTPQERAGTRRRSPQERGKSKSPCALRGQKCAAKGSANHRW